MPVGMKEMEEKMKYKNEFIVALSLIGMYVLGVVSVLISI